MILAKKLTVMMMQAVANDSDIHTYHKYRAHSSAPFKPKLTKHDTVLNDRASELGNTLLNFSKLRAR